MTWLSNILSTSDSIAGGLQAEAESKPMFKVPVDKAVSAKDRGLEDVTWLENCMWYLRWPQQETARILKAWVRGPLAGRPRTK